MLGRVCDDVAALRAAGREVVLVTSGAIAVGIRERGLDARPRAVDELQAASALGQGRLYHVYDRLLAQRGLPSAQILLTFFDLSARTHYLNARQTLRRLLDWQRRAGDQRERHDDDRRDLLRRQRLPRRPGGDPDRRRAAGHAHLDRGPVHRRPRHDADARLVATVDDFDALERFDVGRSTSVLGSGGMRSKVVAAEMATAAGIPTVVGSGLTAGVVPAAVAGEPVGTRFAARPGRYSSFKLWLRYAKPARGHVRVDAGAARALRDGGTSLLPVGIVEVGGAFDAGDAVEVEHDGAVIGKGIVTLSAAELRQVAGMQSAEVRSLLPRASEEAVHRDYFVLT